MTKLPTLYKRTATGALQEWTIIFEGNWYCTQFGQTGGTIQTSAPVLCAGKNNVPRFPVAWRIQETL
jgi:hypothetical protein